LRAISSDIQSVYLKRKIDSYLAERKIAAKFQISRISKDARFKDYRGCMEWLESAGLINICYCLHSPELPLKGNYDETKHKIYFSDSGLLIAMLDDEESAWDRL
ncbi:MAG: DUF4143 domain-containing protein, partial [Lachnospiraceae bacterium]|nr:DUF4143 domain-containing protein [Lachnospiraceae bacterium]